MPVFKVILRETWKILLLVSVVKFYNNSIFFFAIVFTVFWLSHVAHEFRANLHENAIVKKNVHFFFLVPSWTITFLFDSGMTKQFACYRVWEPHLKESKQVDLNWFLFNTANNGSLCVVIKIIVGVKTDSTQHSQPSSVFFLLFLSLKQVEYTLLVFFLFVRAVWH